MGASPQSRGRGGGVQRHDHSRGGMSPLSHVGRGVLRLATCVRELWHSRPARWSYSATARQWSPTSSRPFTRPSPAQAQKAIKLEIAITRRGQIDAANDCRRARRDRSAMSAFAAEDRRRRLTLLPGRPRDGQNRATTSGIQEMSANATAACCARSKAAGATKKCYRLAVAVSLTVLLSGAEVSAGNEDGPAASAPLPPPLPAAPPATGLQRPQGMTPTETPRLALPQSHPRADHAMQASHLHKRNNGSHRVGHSTRSAQGEKRSGRRSIGDVEREQSYTFPRVASTLMPPFAPLPFPYGYMPSAPPPYGYTPVYPTPWPPGPALPR
jgi:hypothetical protein